MNWNNFWCDFIVSALGAAVGFTLTLFGQWLCALKGKKERRTVMLAIVYDELNLISEDITTYTLAYKGIEGDCADKSSIPTPFVMTAWSTLVNTGLALELVSKKYKNLFDKLTKAYAQIEIYASYKDSLSTFGNVIEYLQKAQKCCEDAVEEIRIITRK